MQYPRDSAILISRNFNVLSIYEPCKNFMIVFFILIFTFVCHEMTYAESETDIRPVLVEQGSMFPVFLNKPVERIRLYSFHQKTMQWEAVPFQIDELDYAASYFGAKNGMLDTYDEIGFFYEDGGDSVSADNWLDFESTDTIRYKIRIFNPNSLDDGQYFYLYLSDSAPFAERVYIDKGLHSQFDFVQTPAYRISHGAHGLQDTLIIRPEIGGDGINILDRQKLRVRLSLAYFGNADLNLWEGAKQIFDPLPGLTALVRVRKKDLQYTDQPVIRCHRSMRMEFRTDFTYSGLDYTHIENIMIYSTFNPYDALFRIEALNVEPQPYARVKLIRFSEDLNPNAIGMRLFNAYYETGVRIDGRPDTFSGNLLWPGISWYGLTANPNDSGSLLLNTAIITIINNQTVAIGEDQNIYYQDTVQPVPYDTGDHQSFGDTGILITGCTVAGSLISEWHQYYFPRVLDEPAAYKIVSAHKHPPIIRSTAEFYSPRSFPSFQLPDTSFCEDDTLQIDFEQFHNWLTDNDTSHCEFSFRIKNSEYINVLTDSLNRFFNFFSKTQHWFGSDSIPVTVMSGTDTLANIYLCIFISPVPDPPYPFNLITPLNQGTVVSDTIEFCWQDALDPDPSDTVLYTFELDTSIHFNSPLFNHKKKLNAASFRLKNPDLTGLWYWHVIAFSQDSLVTDCNDIFCFINSPSASMNNIIQKPDELVLLPNYPNPFNASTRIQFALPTVSSVRLQIINTHGQIVWTLRKKQLDAGYYTFSWNGTDHSGQSVSSGIYLVHLQTDQECLIRKICMIR